MKVYIVSRGYPTDKYKMNGIFEMDQAKALKKAGLDVVFLSVDLRSLRRKRKFGTNSFIHKGIRVYSIDIPLGNIPKNILYKIGIWATRKIYKLARKEQGKPDIIHTFFTDQAYMVTKAFEDKGIPIVVTECNSHINKDGKEDIDTSLCKAADYAYRHVDQLISVSPDFQGKIQKNFGVDSKVVTVIPDLVIFDYKPEEKDPRTFNFVSTGRITVAKGMEDLIDAFHMAFKDDESVYLDIFGDGEAREALEKKVDQLGLSHRIKFWGMTDRGQIAKEYQKADAFAMFSHSETFGLAYLEALASGLPVIATRCGGPEHLINEENGILVGVKDVEDQARAMKYMKENTSQYDNEKIAKWANTQYSAKSITEDVVAIYKELVV